MVGSFATLLGKLIRTGNLEVETADGVRRKFGDGSGPKLGARLLDRAAERELVTDPSLALGELYTDGRVVVTEGSLYDILELGARNLATLENLPWVKAIEKARVIFRAVHQRNDRERARQNIARHYDHDVRIYDLFLDDDRQYSCAYFEEPDQSLEEAQRAKKRHIAAKLLVEEGERVLDIGCGFGGMALYLAGVAGVGKATGVTLSREQLAVARARAERSGFADRLDFRLQDYRDVEETFDRIVSVGMFEHVGVARYDEYFQNVRRLLNDDGVMLLHAIGRNGVPGATNPWIRKYIFPGGYIPALSEVLPAIERAGLYVTDIEILRLHYADTLRVWRERFMAHWEEAKAIAGERFCRMWEFYLAGSETSFRVDGFMVFQIQIARRQDAVPLTRAYIAEREEALRRREAEPPALRQAAE
ncbi:cyclopropane-fatty-acyl-phospholipid synthase [Roseiarcus fermentans]|uniref:Cyclopropane-fatty-acyl-phospholipid synthase n=1 Tax=Roseiarcus fermentans TaxID=1473586 RepID=A0A366FTR3_9HYPH|nr:cyclopropane-fatty-acyl-phospholipid synthase family protein [Roseiarcus fermentans]RBP18074.1 cyclopropane-fatty-acyl-phospholipid synthase [Roseiarcus fermentans]